jgi:hypothetical protein
LSALEHLRSLTIDRLEAVMHLEPVFHHMSRVESIAIRRSGRELVTFLRSFSDKVLPIKHLDASGNLATRTDRKI